MFNALTVAESDRILIVAPHPDDESVGCGGLLARYGPQCDVLLLTDGRKGGPADGSKSEDETVLIRKAEFDAAISFFGVNNVFSLALPDSCLAENSGAVSGVDLRPYDLIFVPYRNERHPDHEAAYRILKRLWKKQRAKAKFLEYEVWSPITAPNRFLDISECMNRKLAGIRLYASQTQELNYEALAKGLNSYRGAPHHVSFCEAFFSEAADKKEKKKAAFACLPGWMRKTLLFFKERYQLPADPHK